MPEPVEETPEEIYKREETYWKDQVVSTANRAAHSSTMVAQAGSSALRVARPRAAPPPQPPKLASPVAFLHDPSQREPPQATKRGGNLTNSPPPPPPTRAHTGNVQELDSP
jgi:hypothetical protein